MFGLGARDLVWLGKVMGASTAIAIAIKFLGPKLDIVPTTPNILLSLFLPAGVLALALGWRAKQP